MNTRLLSVATLALAVAALAACQNEPYCLNCADGSVVTDVVVHDVVPLDVAHDNVDVATDAEPDVQPDVSTDGCDMSMTATDPANCGMCGHVCALAHALPACVAGACVIPPGGCDTDWFDVDGDPANGCEYGCTPVPGATNDATCDMRDDNCNGRVDEDVNKCTDVNNCGACGTVCQFAHAVPVCAHTATMGCDATSAHCAIATCSPGFYDINHDPADGCEYACTATGAETCDGVDNDCDGTVDNGDPGGGGVCGSAVGTCHTGINHCVMGHVVCMGATAPTSELCDGLDNDCNGMVDDGTLVADTRIGGVCGSGVGACRPGNNVCRSGAVVCAGSVTPVAEVCNGIDDNCNGAIDDGIPAGASCGSSVGACRPGVLTCVSGATVCRGGTLPTSETCNGIDDDCNGTVDDGYDLQHDVNNCGACGHSCGTVAHAVLSCTSGTCGIAACAVGFVDLDHNAANGCEYACLYQGPTEVCNGLDDNCNGTVDEGVTAPAGFCRTVGPCAGATASCTGARGFVCSYSASVDVDPVTGQPAAAETRCDGIDNNCNGAIDEPFSTLGQVCRVGTAGTACENDGTIVCRADHTGTQCSVSAALPAQPEICNNIDDDCDGSVDETSLAPGTNPSFVPTLWGRVQPSATCGITPGSGGLTQAACTGDTHCLTTSANHACAAGFWCDATTATPTGATPVHYATCQPYFWEMQYEASAPNASATAPGSVLRSTSPRTVSRACSAQGVLPWTNVTPVDAQAACAAAGATLCTEGQWQASCEVRTGAATTGCVFGYETACTTYQPMVCNGLEFDFDTTMAGDQDGLLVTNSTRIPTCAAAWTGFTGATNIFDLTGNAREITAVRATLTNAYPLRGGSYTTPRDGLTCTNNWTLVDNTFFYPNTGFRCCSTSATAP